MWRPLVTVLVATCAYLFGFRWCRVQNEFTRRVAYWYGTDYHMETVVRSNCQLSTLYMNMGMIPESGFRSYADSAETLVRFVLDVGNLSVVDTHVIDVGCGFADQDILAVREYGVPHIECIDATPRFVKVARRRVRDIGLDANIRIHVGDGITYIQRYRNVDVILSIDTVLHLDSRRRFLTNAHTALRTGGRLVISDQVLREGEENYDKVMQFMANDSHEIPESNNVNLSELLESVNELGFRVERIIDISNRSYTQNQVDVDNPIAKIIAEEYGNEKILRDFIWSRGYDYLRFLVLVLVKTG